MSSQFVKEENGGRPLREGETACDLLEGLNEIEWITCRKCKGEIGVPFALRERLVECPGCGLPVKLSETILFRPATPTAPAPLPAQAAPASQPEVQKQPAKASVALLRKADAIFNWGVASIVLGWTFFVPFIGLCSYFEICTEARNENALVPGKATIGLALSLLFGVAQGAAVIAKLTH